MRSRTSLVFNVGDSAVGASEKFISSDSTVGSSRGGISRVGDSSAPRSGESKVKSRSELGAHGGRFAGRRDVVAFLGER